MIEIEGLIARKGAFEMRTDLSVPRGAVCAVIGPSGAGKSTLLEALAGFAEVVAGTARIEGRDVLGLPPAERPLTLLFQENNLFPHLSLAANVGLGLRGRLRLTREEADRVEEALTLCGLDGLGARLPEALSGGQRRRAALARAILRDRPALLLDEPFEGLGPALRESLGALIREIAETRGMATLLVTHDPGDARRAARLVAPCLDGRIDGAREVAEALDDPASPLADYLGARGG
ncbi:MAG: ATP-binding cassette domain-containing protein [Pseudomonadota bacterium]